MATNQSSAMWLMIMAGILVVALPIGMNMLVGMDDTIAGLQAVREQIEDFYESASVSQRLSPPPGQDLEEGQRRERIVVVSLPTEAGILADKKKTEERITAALVRLRLYVTYQEPLAEKVDHIQVDLWPYGEPAPAGSRPPFTKRIEFVPRTGAFDGGTAHTLFPEKTGPVVALLLRADGSMTLDGKAVELTALELRLKRLSTVNATVRLSKELGSDGKLSPAAEATMHTVLASVMRVGIGLEVAAD